MIFDKIGFSLPAVYSMHLPHDNHTVIRGELTNPSTPSPAALLARSIVSNSLPNFLKTF